MRGLGPFRDEVTLDLAELGDATLVAVCGDNGEGKSTFLEFALPGAFYRTTPTQGSLRDRARARDSLLEVTVAGAERYTIRHLVDGTSGKGESVVLDGTGRPIGGSTKVTDYDAWAARHLPPEEVLLASTFGAQQARGFLGATPGERSAILLRARGIARYEAWASGASKQAAACKQQVEVTRARVDELRRQGGDVAALDQQLAQAVVDEHQREQEIVAARRALSELEEQGRAAEAATARHAAHVAKQQELRARVKALEARRDDIAARIAACQRTLSQETAIREAAEKVGALQTQLAELGQQRAALSSRGEAAQQRARTAQSFAEVAERHRTRVAARITELEAVVARGSEIAQAERDLREVESGLMPLREGVASAQAALDQLTSETVAGAESRIEWLRDGLETVGAEASLAAAQATARACLQTDDAAVQAAAERPAKLAQARRALEQCRGLLASAEMRQSQLAALARRSGEVTAARDQLGSLRKELQQHTEAARGHEAATKEASASAQAAGAELAALQQRHDALSKQASGLKALADQLPNIALAASKLEERTAQQQEVAGELEAATWALSELGAAPAPAAAPDLAPARARVAEAERAARAAHQAVAVIANKLEAARTLALQVRELERQQQAEEAELADWTRLADDLGRKGLQAAEIDGCGPALTALVNDLLHSAHGPRWSVRIDTQRLSADGKKTLEACQVTVIDTAQGREDEGSRFSGGERVIIGEALALGLSMLACQSSGMRGVTLVRDETGAALDPGNAEVYVRMLRRAAQQIGADRVLFVCHNPEVSGLADARITVAGGRLLIDAQAGSAAA